MYKIDAKKSLFVLIKNSLGTKLFKSVYFFIDKKSVDIYKKGKLSCAFYVSTILKIIGLVKDIHATVQGLIRDLEESGWYKIDKLKKGAIIIWDKEKSGHLHVGFYLGNNKAASNSSSKRMPIVHSLHYQGRKILAVYFHNSLE
ncbi:MAG: hypothetical protein KatS3mg096_373 [Candidatus Parcubacteria bacterium]|nr:MAG: hypothetical protein KatS3mg096_373 [Candidatus Parcubacteria bacterium]